MKSTGTSLKTPPDFVLLFTISGFRTLRHLHGVRLSILTERRPAPRRACLLCGLAAPLEYTSSPFTSMLTSEPSKGHQAPPGARHLLNPCSLALSLNQKTSSPLSPQLIFCPPPPKNSFSQTSDDDILANVTETLPSARRRPFVLVLRRSLCTFSRHHPTPSPRRTLILYSHK